MSEMHVPVLIVGSGLAGLTTSVMLAWRGVPSLLVERHAGTSWNPRARGVNFRSMELLRVAGLETDLVAAGGQSFADFSIVIAETVTGRKLRTLLERGSWDTTALSPAVQSAAGQDKIEPILRRHAQQLGADLRYRCELVSFEQDARGISAVVRDLKTDETYGVRADYLVAADGHRSPIRERLGVATHGHGRLSSHMGIIFEGDIESVIGGQAFALYYLQNPDFTGVFVNTDTPRRALVAVEYDPARDSPASFDVDRCKTVVRAALGVPQFEATIREVLPWEMSSRVADPFSVGRVFLAGDAAHTMPPTGGLGGQTAIQDGYDIAWKLALVLQGDAGAALLDTYAAERQPVAELTVARQTANYAERMRPDREDLAERPAATRGPRLPDYMEVAFGYRCRSAAIAAEPPDDGAPTESPLAPSGRPGTRAPHVPFLFRGARISSLDLIGRRFALLCGPQGSSWARAANLSASGGGLPLCVYRVGADLIDVEGKWSAFGAGHSGAVLMRPDGLIAWRARQAARAPEIELTRVLAQVLCRPVDGLRAAGTRGSRGEADAA
jgi:putative polyketide hydroxylase